MCPRFHFCAAVFLARTGIHLAERPRRISSEACAGLIWCGRRFAQTTAISAGPSGTPISQPTARLRRPMYALEPGESTASARKSSGRGSGNVGRRRRRKRIVRPRRGRVRRFRRGFGRRRGDKNRRRQRLNRRRRYRCGDGRSHDAGRFRNAHRFAGRFLGTRRSLRRAAQALDRRTRQIVGIRSVGGFDWRDGRATRFGGRRRNRRGGGPGGGLFARRRLVAAGVRRSACGSTGGLATACRPCRRVFRWLVDGGFVADGLLGNALRPHAGLGNVAEVGGFLDRLGSTSWKWPFSDRPTIPQPRWRTRLRQAWC